MKHPTPELTEVICWTRMQAEAGQDLETIVARKELDRISNNGVFFWGVGNAPNRSVADFVRKRQAIDVVFSQMKTQPKSLDTSPDGILAWQSYFDIHGVEHILPQNLLVTSRMSTLSTTKRVHYALVCRSDDELRIADNGPFDPSIYRNVSVAEGPIGNSQVTAIVRRTNAIPAETCYRISMKARLTGNYWVKLGQPAVLTEEDHETFTQVCASAAEMSSSDWVEVVKRIRANLSASIQYQHHLF